MSDWNDAGRALVELQLKASLAGVVGEAGVIGEKLALSGVAVAGDTEAARKGESPLAGVSGDLSAEREGGPNRTKRDARAPERSVQSEPERSVQSNGSWDEAMEIALVELSGIEARIAELVERRTKLRDDILASVLGSEDQSFRGAAGTATVVRARRVKVTREALLPLAMLKSAPDVAAIRKAIDGGAVVPGAELVDDEPSLRVTWARSE